MPPQNQIIPLIARDGSVLPVLKKAAPPIPQNIIADANKQFRREHKVRVRNARFTEEYNCRGLTFAAKLGWFDQVRTMLACHHYNKVGVLSNFDIDEFDLVIDVVRGDIVVYFDGSGTNVTHTGVVWSKKKTNGKLYLTVMSKWGSTSEYFHRHDRVPLGYGKSIEVWTDREI